jgi:hypothetical protein
MDVASQYSKHSCDKGSENMKLGEVVRFRDEDYRVGVCSTDTSVELVELADGSKGLWVSRDEVHKAFAGPDCPEATSEP